MDNRRDFLRKAALLSGAVGFSALPPSIQKALAINPDPGSTFLDAEHVVFLMQENRSFDHCYGALQGVRGFNDPRAIRLPNKNLAWLQTNAAGKTYAPFRLNIKDTKITWMGSLPHSWSNQVDARNNGKYDKWLDVKNSGHKEYADMPLTMGHYTREDIPFYYALADAFTVCDQNFCSSLTGTTPNRLFFWTGTIREEQNENSNANVWNEDADYDTSVKWKTYPERLEENGVSWKIYQNDISVDGGFTDEEDSWMANFGDNPIEYFEQYNVKLSERYINYIQKKTASLPGEIDATEKQLNSLTAADKNFKEVEKKLNNQKKLLKRLSEEKLIYTREKYDALSQHDKNLHEKAFSNNKSDPAFYKLTNLKYNDGGVERDVNIPKGDILHQFREDVKSGNLPTVSWIVAPENFSDHPSSAWYGAWYVSEVMDILTQNPEVWKKTIFVLNYDENDGYYDHVPPFVAPNPNDAHAGKTSASIDTRTEYVTMEQEMRKKNYPAGHRRESSIGLGYRVPLVVASPWSRGGWINSEVFDHTSSLQFLEKFLEKKTGKTIQETNISSWRRAICGDLTSVFRKYNGEKIPAPEPVNKEVFVESIHKAKFKNVPGGYKQLSPDEIERINQNPHLSDLMPKQEKGTRTSCALPYELYVNSRLSADRKTVEVLFDVKNEIFAERAAGAPFSVYAPGKYKGEDVKVWSYGIVANDRLQDSWPLADFENGIYHLQAYGPNGFFRELKGASNDPLIDVFVSYQQGEGFSKKLTGNVEIKLSNTGPQKHTVEIIDNAYQTPASFLTLDAASGKHAKDVAVLDLTKSSGWYDFTVRVKSNTTFEKRFAGRVETGKPSISDPAMGNV
ncbi:phosphocholine-specific phospholipase C [Chitinophagaceae bacterium LWZ2-11]